MKYSMNTTLFSITLMFMSILLLYNNFIISMEIPIINMNSFNIPISLLIDWISCLFMSTVMFISSMIIMFSMFYIPKKEHKKFSILLLMFITSMMILIMSDNIIFILLGWDGLGLSSYILVIYYQNHSSSASGSITLLSNRIGDIMILLSISILMINNNWNFFMNKEYNFISMIFIMTAACTKSAQFPFSAWLPAAMAAPTPISALVHSSTLVTAGVYLLIRIMNNPHPMSLLIMMLISSATALYASMSANWELDMKKIIALSTLSQIAMMMFAISMKSSLMAFFHLISHAMFKSTMFLCAGIIIHKSSYQDMRKMSLNNNKIPLTLSMMSLTTMALMALPFMSGFFSKDIIIEIMLTTKLNSTLSYLMIFSIGMTSSYTLRMMISSLNQSFKSKPDSNFHKIPYANKSISMMAPLSIFLGSSLMWMLNPEQMLIIPQKIKLSIMLMLIMGMIIGYSLTFKSTSFNKWGTSSTSLWFTHFISTIPMKSLSPLMMLLSNNDHTWQENYGPQGTMTLNMKMSKTPDLLKMTIMFTLILLMLNPMI